jgi:transposase-like protein
MTNFEKRERVILELYLDPARTNRDIARSLDCSEGLVRDVRQEL